MWEGRAEAFVPLAGGQAVSEHGASLRDRRWEWGPRLSLSDPSTCHSLAGAFSGQAGHWRHPQAPWGSSAEQTGPQGLSVSVAGTRRGQRLLPSQRRKLNKNR